MTPSALVYDEQTLENIGSVIVKLPDSGNVDMVSTISYCIVISKTFLDSNKYSFSSKEKIHLGFFVCACYPTYA